jgi:hypothetical protein
MHSVSGSYVDSTVGMKYGLVLAFAGKHALSFFA